MAELGGCWGLCLGRIGAANHRKPAANSGHYRVMNAQDSNELSTFREVGIRA
jgi:hypothetical protein